MQGFKFGQEHSTAKTQIEEQMGRQQPYRNVLEVAYCLKKKPNFILRQGYNIEAIKYLK